MNKFLLFLIVLFSVIARVVAYVADSGECLLMENIHDKLNEYKTYKTKIADTELELSNYSGLINTAKADADAASADVRAVNDKATTKSNWAGGLSIASTVMNIGSSIALGVAASNNKKTMKNLNTMHDTLSNMKTDSGSPVMSKQFSGDQLVADVDIEQLVNKAKCLSQLFDKEWSLIGNKQDKPTLDSGEEFYFSNLEDVELPDGMLAVRNSDDGKQDVMFCNKIKIKDAVKGFLDFGKNPDNFSKYMAGCRWRDENNFNGYYGRGSKTINVSSHLLKSAANVFSSRFDSIFAGGLYKSKAGYNSEFIGNLSCYRGELFLTKRNSGTNSSTANGSSGTTSEDVAPGQGVENGVSAGAAAAQVDEVNSVGLASSSSTSISNNTVSKAPAVPVNSNSGNPENKNKVPSLPASHFEVYDPREAYPAPV